MEPEIPGPKPVTGAIGHQFARGVTWTAVGLYAVQFTQFVTTAILSRMLKPSDFGLVAMVTVVTSYIDLFVEAGVGSVVVQRRDLTSIGLSSLFWLTAGSGAVLGAGVAAAAPLIAHLYSFPDLAPIARAVALNLLLAGLTIVPANMLRRELRFRRLALIDIGSAVTGAVLAIILARQGAGYWALVAQLITVAGCRAGLVLALSGWRPQLGFDGKQVRQVMGYSLYVMGFNSVNYWARNADNLLVGRFLGASALGYYSHAYSLMMVPLRILTSVINPVLHPVLAAIQSDREKQAQAYLQVVRVIALVSVPLAAGMWVAAEPLVLAIWGPGWEPVIPVFRVLAILAAIQPAVSTSGAVFMARNRTDWFFWLGLANAVVMVAGIALGLRWGIVGVAVGYAVSYGAVVLPTMYVVMVRLLGSSLGRLARELGIPLVSGLVVSLSIWVMQEALGPAWLPGPRLVVLIATGAVALALVELTLDRTVAKMLLSALSPIPARGRSTDRPGTSLVVSEARAQSHEGSYRL